MTMETDRSGLRIARVISVIALTLGVAAIATRLLDAPGLISLRRFVSPLSAAGLQAFMVLGSAVFLRSRWPHRPLARLLGVCAGLTVASLSALWLSRLPLGLDAGMERLLGAVPGIFPEAPGIGLTVMPALVFLLASLSLLASLLPAERWRPAPGVTCTLACCVTGIGLVAVLAQLYGASLLRPGFEEQVAAAAWIELRTTVVSLLLGSAMLGIAGETAWPARMLAGPSTRARLLRAFLPYITAIVLIEGFLDASRFTELPVNPTVLIALKVVLLAVATALVVAVVAGRMGGALDSAQAELRRRGERFRLLYEEAPLPYQSLDAEGRVLDVNSAWLRTLGYSFKEEVLGRWFGEFLPLEFRELFRQRFSIFKEEGEIHGLEFVVIRRDGTTVTVSYDGRVGRNPDGSFRQTHCVFADVTEQKEAALALRDSEQKYRQLVELAQEGIWAIDAGERTTFVNPRMAQILGYTAQEMLGRPLFSFMDESNVDLCKALLERRRGGVIERHDFDFLRKDGSAVCVSMETAPIVDEAGRYMGALAVVADITRRVQAERRVRDDASRLRDLSRRLLEAQETERRRVARELHDDLGQALLTLRLNLQAIGSAQDPSVAGRVQEGLEVVSDAIARVRDLSLALRPSLLDDLGLVPALRWQMDSLAQRFGLSASIVVEPSEIEVPSDVATTCFRVAQGAMLNTARHAAASHLWVEVRRRDRTLCLVVRDDGIGFDVDATIQRARRGESLGLLSMIERVDLAGGEMEIDSGPGRGTTVEARLPLSQGAERPAALQ